MEQIRSCPFCGGRGRVSFKDARFAGQNYRGDKKIVYRVQIICNRCASRGNSTISRCRSTPSKSGFGSARIQISGLPSRTAIRFSQHTDNPDDVYNNPVDCAVTHWMPLPEAQEEGGT